LYTNYFFSPGIVGDFPKVWYLWPTWSTYEFSMEFLKTDIILYIMNAQSLLPLFFWHVKQIILVVKTIQQVHALNRTYFFTIKTKSRPQSSKETKKKYKTTYGTDQQIVVMNVVHHYSPFLSLCSSISLFPSLIFFTFARQLKLKFFESSGVWKRGLGKFLSLNFQGSGFEITAHIHTHTHSELLINFTLLFLIFSFKRHKGNRNWVKKGYFYVGVHDKKLKYHHHIKIKSIHRMNTYMVCNLNKIR
jgi:hypothetical protein